MKKVEFIEKYGIESYEAYKKRRAEYARAKRQEYKEYYEKNSDKIRKRESERCKIKYTTQEGRAYRLYKAYMEFDKKMGLDTDITPEWIIENIFNHKCNWCGETDWRKMGCDRIDNTKGHTIDNVVPSCGKCNIHRGSKSFERYTTSKERLTDNPNYSKKYYEAHKEEKKEYCRRYRESHPTLKEKLGEEGYKAYKHNAYMKNREKRLAYQKEYNRKEQVCRKIFFI